jgi:hypothetical protein
MFGRHQVVGRGTGVRIEILGLLLISGCATTPKQLAGAHLARFEQLDVVLGNAQRSACMQGLEPIPATVIDVGIFKNVPYQSFSNGRVELNGYGDPANLVALEAGTHESDEVLKRCIIQFLSEQTLSASDGARVAQAPFVQRSESVDGLTVETTTPEAADACGAWWLSLELTEDVSNAAASSDEMTSITTASSSWSSGSSSPSRYRSYRASSSSGGPVFVHAYTKKNGTYVHSHTRRR